MRSFAPKIVRKLAGASALASGAGMVFMLLLAKDGPSVGLWSACWGTAAFYLALASA